MCIDHPFDCRRLSDLNLNFVCTDRISQRQSEHQNLYHSPSPPGLSVPCRERTQRSSTVSCLPGMTAETILSFGMPCRDRLHGSGLMTLHTVLLTDQTLMVGVVRNHRIAILRRG